MRDLCTLRVSSWGQDVLQRPDPIGFIQLVFYEVVGVDHEFGVGARA
jgi:hypothetical protein